MNPDWYHVDLPTGTVSHAPLQVYDHAASLQQASQQLKKALELSQQSSHVFAKKVDQLHAEVDR